LLIYSFWLRAKPTPGLRGESLFLNLLPSLLGGSTPKRNTKRVLYNDHQRRGFFARGRNPDKRTKTHVALSKTKKVQNKPIYVASKVKRYLLYGSVFFHFRCFDASPTIEYLRWCQRSYTFGLVRGSIRDSILVTGDPLSPRIYSRLDGL